MEGAWGMEDIQLPVVLLYAYRYNPVQSISQLFDTLSFNVSYLDTLKTIITDSL